MKKLRYKDEKFILITKDETILEGAIATEEEFESFALNRYHLFANGDIMSFGDVVGNVSEIEWLD